MSSRPSASRSTRSRVVATSKSSDPLANPELKTSASSSKLKATRVPVMAAASGKVGTARQATKGPALSEVTNRTRTSTSSSTGSVAGVKDGLEKSKSVHAASATVKPKSSRVLSSQSDAALARSRGLDGPKEAAVRMNAAMQVDNEDRATSSRSQRAQPSASSTAPPAKRRLVVRSKAAPAQQPTMDLDEAGAADETVRPVDADGEEMHDSELEDLAAVEIPSETDEYDQLAHNYSDNHTARPARSRQASAAASGSSFQTSADGSSTVTSSVPSTANTTPWLDSGEQFGTLPSDEFGLTEAEEDALLAQKLDPECLLRLTPDLERAAQDKKAHIISRYIEEVLKPEQEKTRQQRFDMLRTGEITERQVADEEELELMGLDPDEVRDTTMVAEYAEDIFGYMARCERNTMPNPNYMDFQSEIQWYMRGTLVDWLLQVHVRYHMLPETLWIAINIIDRFLSVRVVALQKLQLVGVTSMFIAAKYEEILAPSVDEFVFMTENGYSKEEILKGERIILSTLDFNVSTYCTPYSWVRRISKADDYDIHTRTLSKFLMEVTLLDHRFIRARPSMVAAMSMFLAKKMLGGDWDSAFVYYSNYTEEQLVPGANLVLERLIDPAFEEQFVCKKYSNKKFLKASTYAREWARQNHRQIAEQAASDEADSSDDY